MAGSFCEITIRDSEVRKALADAAKAMGNLEPAFRDFGEYMLTATRARFERMEAPDGTKWAPLSARYLKRKTRNRDKILTFRGDLKDYLRYSVEPGRFQYGTNQIYGASMQFGRKPKGGKREKGTGRFVSGEGRGIPARPFLGLSTEDKTEFLAILSDHIVARRG